MAAALCAPIESCFTTAKVAGTDEVHGCCCCMDLRGGALTMSGSMAFLSLVGAIWNVYVVTDKGVGVPQGYPPEFPANGLFAFTEILGIIESLVGAAVFTFAFLRISNREMKNLRTVFRIIMTLVVYMALVTLVLNPIMMSQICNELSAENIAACRNDANKSACYVEANPMTVWGGDKQRCAWADARQSCDPNPKLGSAAACEIAGILFSTALMLPFVLLLLYFLFVLNAYIVRYDANEGQGMVEAASADEGKVAAEAS